MKKEQSTAEANTLQKKGKYEIDMSNGPILSKMLIFAVPLMCSSILQLLFNAADIIVVGRFAGEDSLAAVGSNGALINLLINMFIGLSIGTNVLVARYYGARMEKELSKTVHTSMVMAFISGLFLLAVGIIGARQILIWMQTPDEVLNLAVLYLRIFFLGMPALMLYNFGSAVLRAVGDTRRPLYYLLGSGIVNVGLNLLFVIQFHWDVAGVAAATVISQFISAYFIVRCLIKEKGSIRLEKGKCRMEKATLARIMRIGVPAGFQGMVFSFSNVIIQSSINSFGKTMMAGNAAAANLEMFVYFAMNAFYQATLSFTSQNMGSKQTKRIIRILLIGQLCVIVTGTVFGNFVYIFGSELLGLYSTKAVVINAGMIRLGYIAKVYALGGMMDVMVGALRGMGYSIMPMLVSLIGACGLRLVWLATVFQMPQYHNIEIVYLSYPVTWTITLSVHIVCFIWAIRRLIKGSGPVFIEKGSQ